MDLIIASRNINHGRNAEVARRSKPLAEYSAFVAKVREFWKECGDKTEAVRQAVAYCCNHDILPEFLEKHSKAVFSMLMTEWSWNDALAVRYEEGRQEGWEGGRQEGWEGGRQEGVMGIIELLKSGKSPEDIIREFAPA